jgi:hypothetical protein
MSSSDLSTLTALKLEQFQRARTELSSKFDSFSSAIKPLPADCDEIAKSIKKLKESVQGFNNVLDSSPRLPDNAFPNRYRILLPLHQINTLSEQSLPLIRLYRRVCLEHSREALQLYERVQRKVEVILRTSEDIEPACSDFLTSPLAQ